MVASAAAALQVLFAVLLAVAFCVVAIVAENTSSAQCEESSRLWLSNNEIAAVEALSAAAMNGGHRFEESLSCQTAMELVFLQSSRFYHAISRRSKESATAQGDQSDDNDDDALLKFHDFLHESSWLLRRDETAKKEEAPRLELEADGVRHLDAIMAPLVTEIDNQLVAEEDEAADVSASKNNNKQKIVVAALRPCLYLAGIFEARSDNNEIARLHPALLDVIGRCLLDADMPIPTSSRLISATTYLFAAVAHNHLPPEALKSRYPLRPSTTAAGNADEDRAISFGGHHWRAMLGDDGAALRLIFVVARLPLHGAEATPEAEAALTAARYALLSRLLPALKQQNENEEKKVEEGAATETESEQKEQQHVAALRLVVGSGVIPWASSLALLCFDNEYVFAESLAETSAVDDLLRPAVQRAVAAATALKDWRDPASGDDALTAVAQSSAFAVLASYRPLSEVLPWSSNDPDALLRRDLFLELIVLKKTNNAERPPAYISVLAQQLQEPAEEALLRRNFHLEQRKNQQNPVAGRGSATWDEETTATASVTRAVQAMYEASPYPRWRDAFGCVPEAPRACQYPPHASAGYSKQLPMLRRWGAESGGRRGSVTGRRLRVLFAGCGTGRQVVAAAVVAAQQGERMDIVAIDLSASSLAYAQRQLGATARANSMLRLALNEARVTVNFRQRNLLTITADDFSSYLSTNTETRNDNYEDEDEEDNDGDTSFRFFDVIEVTGVLHHLADPGAGLASLVRLLHPAHGAIKIALYSRAGREHAGVYAAQQRLAEQQNCGAASRGPGWCNSTQLSQQVRAARAMVLQVAANVKQRSGDSNDNDTKISRLLNGDLHSVSDTRDLLFHPHEIAYDLPGVAALLDGQQLQFLGFDLPQGTLQRFAQEFPRTRGSAGPLWWSDWHTFEQQHPETFAAMYQLWAVRRAKM